MTCVAKIKVGISSCLLGQQVRFDGGHKHLRLCTDSLARYFDFVAECPEVGIGMGIPRKPIRLVGDVDSPRAVAVHDASIEYTDALRDYGRQKAAQHQDLCGYIFMKNSPSCGVYRVKVYQESGYPDPAGGRGIYAEAFIKAHPLLPVEESGRLSDPLLRENFITRVFAYHNWQQLQKGGMTHHKLVEFHASYKYCLMAHSPADYAALGRMVAQAGKHEINLIGARYFSSLMASLSKLASRKTHANVLMHLQGYLKKNLSPAEKHELADIIDQYRRALLPLIVPVTLLKHHFNNHPNPYIEKQAYLQPYPGDLGLRNVI
ncbi:YbgA family protein [Methylophaga lonarensis]|uniref:YbgA family protein n=1 Tax=Methylophaga lonarensis TaxID=999151 RepID=UPI00058D81D1